LMALMNSTATSWSFRAEGAANRGTARCGRAPAVLRG
jgi:hypothetical protein